MAQSKFFRPMYPMRPYRPQRPRIATGGGGGGGIGIGNPADLVKQLGAAVQQQRAQAALQSQNQVANQMMNTQIAPRAALVSPGVNPRTGAANVVRPTVMTAGTAPFTGGMDELQARVNAQKLINQLYPNAAIGQARAAAALGGGARGPVGPAAGSRSGWARQGAGGAGGGRTRAPATSGGGGGGGGKNAPVDTNAPQNPAQYNFNTMRTQFDAQHGKGAYDSMSPFLDNIHPPYDPNSKDPNQTPPDTGLWTNAKGGLDYYKNGKLQTSLMGNDANYWLDRINTARSNAGLDPIATQLQGKGTMDNPYVLNSPWQYGNVPYNQYFTTTDNPQIGQKLRPEDAPKMAAAQIALGGRGGAGEDYLSSWAGAMGGKTTGPDLPAPTPVAPETGGAGYSASFGAQGAAPEAGTEFGPAPNDQAYTSRFNPPVQPPTPDDQAYTARFNPQIPPPVASPPVVPVTAQAVGVPPSTGSSGAASYLDSVQPPPQPGIDPNLLMGGT